MPQVAVVVWIALMDIGLTVGAANAVMFVLKFIATTAASMAASKLLAPKAPSYSDPSLTDRSQMIRSPIRLPEQEAERKGDSPATLRSTENLEPATKRCRLICETQQRD